MQQISLILFAYLLSKEGDFKQTLSSALAFYKENKELISMLVQSPTPEEKPRDAERKEQENSQPQSVGNLSVLQEFLSGLH